MTERPESEPHQVAKELDLVDQDDEQLEPDTSPEAAAEAGMSDTGPDGPPPDEVAVEDVADDEPAPRGTAHVAQLLRVTRALRRQGVTVKATAGWQTRMRPDTFEPRGVMFHHTASNPAGGPTASLGTVVQGRPNLAGPLCELLVARDGTVFLISGGRSNHAGFGGPWINIPKDSGNRYTYGVEVENDGKHEPWSQDLLETCELVFATILLDLRRAPGWLMGHKEWAPVRKPDPSRIDMDRFRRRVAATMSALGSA
jgi:N-acetylmuramoyl-L-alanine amidase